MDTEEAAVRLAASWSERLEMSRATLAQLVELVAACKSDEFRTPLQELVVFRQASIRRAEALLDLMDRARALHAKQHAQLAEQAQRTVA